MIDHKLEAMVEPLLAWYQQQARVLPWREYPTPYRVWVSEIMLQQTRVEAVKPYFERFVSALPDVTALAQAKEEQLLKLWEGLGYYNRVRNMQKAAKILVEQCGGQFVADYHFLLTLPGIGAYTAGAIASIAFGIPVAAVDGNVLRVITRLTANPNDVTKEAVKKQITKQIENIIPVPFSGDFNQALMELGATVCLPHGEPLCNKCPLKSLCISCQRGNMLDYPQKPPKKGTEN